jgi:hypothetical protein
MIGVRSLVIQFCVCEFMMTLSFHLCKKKIQICKNNNKCMITNRTKLQNKHIETTVKIFKVRPQVVKVWLNYFILNNLFVPNLVGSEDIHW